MYLYTDISDMLSDSLIAQQCYNQLQLPSPLIHNSETKSNKIDPNRIIEQQIQKITKTKTVYNAWNRLTSYLAVSSSTQEQAVSAPVKPPYRERVSKDKRLEEAARVRIKYKNNRIPVIIERLTPDTPYVEGDKLLVPCDLTISQFMDDLRNNIKFSADKGLFIMIKTPSGIVIPPMTSTISQIEKEHKEEDFLYIGYAIESTFG